VRLLVLGGTVFLGRAVVADALDRGHDVTVFNRGSHPGVLAGVTELRGERASGDLAALTTGSFDAVVDTSGYVPRLVAESARLLASRAGRYCFVSSVSVYAPQAGPITEDGAILTMPDETDETVDEHYGALKALCERAAAEATGGRSLAVRAGLIVGPHDPTGRFSHWPHRFARGGAVLVFDGPARRLQFIDVRDLAAYIVGACEQGVTGPVNVTATHTLGNLVDACLAHAPGGTRPVWVKEERLRAAGVGQWLELPLWIDSTDPEAASLDAVATERARATGLRVRPLADTVAATLAGAAPVAGVGLTPEREGAILSRR
jgi:2'-hydroxyisoflavone reductase